MDEFFDMNIAPRDESLLALALLFILLDELDVLELYVVTKRMFWWKIVNNCHKMIEI